MAASTSSNGNGHASSATPHDRLGDAPGQADGASPPASKTPSERDGRGRFALGNKGGPGNPFARKVAAIRRCFLEAVNEEEITALVRQIYQRAMAGDTASAKLFFHYTIGQNTPYANPDTLDVQEWQQLTEDVMSTADLHKTLQSMPTNSMIDVVKITRQALVEKMTGEFVEKLEVSLERDARVAEAKERAAKRKEMRKQARQEQRDALKVSVVARSPDRVTDTTEGLLTRPETCGRDEWHGHETLPQRDGHRQQTGDLRQATSLTPEDTHPGHRQQTGDPPDCGADLRQQTADFYRQEGHMVDRNFE